MRILPYTSAILLALRFHRTSEIIKMLKIWNMKKDAAAEGNHSLSLYPTHPSHGPPLTRSATKKPKISAAQIRVQKGSTIIHIIRLTSTDLTELSLPSTMRISFSNPDDILNFTLTIEPDEGISLMLEDRINDSRNV